MLRNVCVVHAVQQAMHTAHSTYRPPAARPAARSVARPAARPAPQAVAQVVTQAVVQSVVRPRIATRAGPPTYPMPPGYESAPAGTKKWLNHVYSYHLAHPTLSRGQAIGAAIMSYRGPANKHFKHPRSHLLESLHKFMIALSTGPRHTCQRVDRVLHLHPDIIFCRLHKNTQLSGSKQ